MSVFFCGDCYALSGKVFSRFMVVNCVLRKIFHRQYELFAKSHPASVIASVLGIKCHGIFFSNPVVSYHQQEKEIPSPIELPNSLLN